MAKYVTKPVKIEAVQLNWRNWGEVCDFLGNIISSENPGRSVKTYSDTCGEDEIALFKPFDTEAGWLEITIPTREGNMIASHGDYIIKGLKGEFYPCKPDIFKMKYEEVK